MDNKITVKLSILDGTATLVYHPHHTDQAARVAAALGETTQDQRGAYVYPLSPVLRRVFKALRRSFGDRGPISDFTRAWRCRWAVVLPGEHVRLPGVYQSHSEAVTAEVQWICQKN